MSDPIELPTYPDEDLAELSPPKLTDILIENAGRVPRNVIDECVRRGDKMTEYLDILVAPAPRRGRGLKLACGSLLCPATCGDFVACSVVPS